MEAVKTIDVKTQAQELLEKNDKKYSIFDTHCHLNDPRFLDDENFLIQTFARAKAFNVDYITIPGYDLVSSKDAVLVATKYAKEHNLYALVGLHPSCAKEYMESTNSMQEAHLLMEKEVKEIEKLIVADLAKEKDQRVIVGIGEIGLDYYWDKEEDVREFQKVLFLKQIELANKYDIPIAIHTRDATLDTIQMMQEHPVNKRGIMHCCPLNEHLIKECVKLGYYISFSGVVTFKNANPIECIRLVPIDKILCETDAPYLAPVPNRGKTNEAFNTYYVAEFVAKTIGMDLAEFADIEVANAKKIYNIQ